MCDSGSLTGVGRLTAASCCQGRHGLQRPGSSCGSGDSCGQLRAAEGSCLCRHGPRVLRGSCGRGACSCSLHSAQPSIDLTLAPSYLAPLILTRDKCGVRTRVFVRTRVCGDTCIDRSIPAPLLLSTTRCRHAGERWGHHQMAGHISKIPSLCSPLSSHIAMHYLVVLRTQTRAFLPFF